MRPRQLLGRARRLVPPGALARGLSPPHDLAWRSIAYGAGVDPAPQSGPTPPPEEDGRFTAMGAARELRSRAFWEDPADGLLFLFHLHGFSPLAEYAAGDRRNRQGDTFWMEVIRDWLRCNARPAMPGWHPHPTSVRVISWAAALSTLDGWPGDLRFRMVEEVWRQARYVRRCVEHDIGGNHVIKNATALTVAGACLSDSSLASAGLGLLRREVGEQLLADGGHEERSTSYHRVVLSDLRDAALVLARSGRLVPAWLSDAIAAAEGWAAEMAGPDGRLPLLNDAWEGPPLGGERRRTPARALNHLRDSGYVVLSAAEDRAIFDVGPICPAHLPPHAHADTLSFVFWAAGRPLVVDPGSFLYTGPWRDSFRSTAAHNTVEVDGRDQCEFWGDFRAAHRPRVGIVQQFEAGGVMVFHACHDGYRRLDDPVEHHRALVWAPGDGLVVVDLLRALKRHSVRSRLHLAPGTRLEDGRTRDGFVFAALGEGARAVQDEAWYSPYLVKRVPAPVLEHHRVAEPEVAFGWSILREGVRVTELNRDRLTFERSSGEAVSIPLRWG